MTLKQKADAEQQSLAKERDKAIRLLNEQKANEQQHIDRAVHEATGRHKAITEELQWKSALLNALADLLYRTVEVFRRAIGAIIDFATSQYKSVFSSSGSGRHQERNARIQNDYRATIKRSADGYVTMLKASIRLMKQNINILDKVTDAIEGIYY